MKRPLIPLAACLAAALVAAPAAAAEGAWSSGTKANVRIIAAGIAPDGTVRAGIEIVMPEGWHTYWRTPGEAGIAPQFDFTGSENVGDVGVEFPLPVRLDDGFAVTNIYRDRVVLPLKVVATDPSAPVTLSVAMELGVCEEICVPDTVTASVEIPAGETDEAVAAVLAEAEAALPQPAEPGSFAVDSAMRSGGSDKRPVFRFVATVPDAHSAEIFVEGPTDWAPYAPKPTESADGNAAWDVKFSRLGAETPVEGATFRLTIVSGGRAIEQSIVAN